MKKVTLIILGLLAALSASAQYDTLTIQQIQTVPAGQLAACNDTSAFSKLHRHYFLRLKMELSNSFPSFCRASTSSSSKGRVSFTAS